MSEIYNFASTISEGNKLDETHRAINRQIDAQNSLARDNFSRLRQGEEENKNIAEGNVKATEVKDREDEGLEGGKVISGVNDLTAKRTESSVDSSAGAEKPQEVVPELRPIEEGGAGGDSNAGATEQNVGEGLTKDLVREKVDFDSDRLFTSEGSLGMETGGSIGLNPIGSGYTYTIRAYPVNEGVANNNVGDLVRPIEGSSGIPSAEDIPESFSNAKKGLSGLVKSVGTEGGVLGEGLSGALKGATILTGGYDAIKDIADPKSFKDLDTAGKISNVAGIVSGGLEAVGVGLDATGVGLGVGSALIGAGGLISGAVGLASGIIDDVRKEGEQQKSVANMPTISASAKPPQQQQQAFKSAFQGGQLVQ